jgi:hypothetical protein
MPKSNNTRNSVPVKRFCFMASFARIAAALVIACIVSGGASAQFDASQMMETLRIQQQKQQEDLARQQIELQRQLEVQRRTLEADLERQRAEQQRQLEAQQRALQDRLDAQRIEQQRQLEEQQRALQAQRNLITSPPPQTTPAYGTSRSTTYSFKETAYGTVEVYENGQRIGTGTPQYAAQFGYAPGSAPPASSPNVTLSSTYIPAIPTTQTTAQNYGVKQPESGFTQDELRLINSLPGPFRQQYLAKSLAEITALKKSGHWEGHKQVMNDLVTADAAARRAQSSADQLKTSIVVGGGVASFIPGVGWVVASGLALPVAVDSYLQGDIPGAAFALAGAVPGGNIGRGGSKLIAWLSDDAARVLSASDEAFLLHALSGRGPFGFVQRTSRSESDRLGGLWVGDGYTVSKDGTAWLSADKLRQYRRPAYKQNLSLTQSNFERRSSPSGYWENDGHLDVF